MTIEKLIKEVEKSIKANIKEFPERNASVDNTAPDITYDEAIEIEVEDMHPFIAYDVGYVNGMQDVLHTLQFIQNKNK
jgi:hypothetical protein